MGTQSVAVTLKGLKSLGLDHLARVFDSPTFAFTRQCFVYCPKKLVKSWPLNK